jgi:peroxiredoxin
MGKQAHLQFNDPAPDLVLVSIDRDSVRLSSLWVQKTLLLAFTRHFGCPQCKEMVDQLFLYKGSLADHGITPVFVTQAQPEMAKAFANTRAPGMLWLCDPERKAYRAYGLGPGSLFQTLLSRRVWQSNRQIEDRKGWKPELPPAGQSAFLMSGTFIIGSDGRVRLPYYYDDIADHPPIDLLLNGVLGTDWIQPFEGPVAPAEE